MISLMFKPIRTISQFNTILQQSLASADRVFHVLDFKDERLEQQKEPNLPPIRGEIEFRNVSFTYNDQEKVVDSISFCIESGKIIALVGPSGHGKTTLLNLILRFYEATLGEILIDGYRISDFSLGSLRRQIAIVPQETILFSGTIRANVAYGKADITDSDILKATKLANAHDFIVDLPNGYETEVGESGLMLSGGERQRISIARAIAKNPRILLLDEATSSLDSESESLIQQSLSYLMKGQTTFVIAHRLSTIINADEIFVLNKGKITERGTHQKLIRENGLYQKLTEIQFR
jgi:subfamily B ATP-binding cassette protein MsbA